MILGIGDTIDLLNELKFIIQNLPYFLLALLLIFIIKLLIGGSIAGLSVVFQRLSKPFRDYVWFPSISKFVQIFNKINLHETNDNPKLEFLPKSWQHLYQILKEKDHFYNSFEIKSLPRNIKLQLLFVLRNDPSLDLMNLKNVKKINEIDKSASEKDYEKIAFFLNNNISAIHGYTQLYRDCLNELKSPLDIYLFPEKYKQDTNNFIFSLNIKLFKKYMRKIIFHEFIEAKRRKDLEENSMYLYFERQSKIQVGQHVFLKYEESVYISTIEKISNDFWDLKQVEVTLKEKIIKKNYEDENRFISRIVNSFENSLSNNGKLNLERIIMEETKANIPCTDIFLIKRKDRYKW